jgi:thiopeptide-type bacteriocin biosynthesis protein
MTEQRTFIIGDEWLYFKVYTGFKTADTILIETIYPLSQQLLKNNQIDCWFFIRYSDPQFHLRIRFHIPENENIVSVIHQFNNVFQDYVNQNLVWKIQTDTYQREMERYSAELIELSEKLFHLNSEMICKTIALDEVQQDENLRWLLGLKMTDTLLTDFGYTLEEKHNLLNTLQDNFGKEFGITADFRRQFGQKYRTEKSRIEKILDKTTEQDNEYVTLFRPIFENSYGLTHLTLLQPHNDLLSSYIHMMLNRLFRTQQRTHELVLYDYLFRYYNSLLARQK